MVTASGRGDDETMTPHRPHRTARHLLIGTALIAAVAIGIGAWLFIMDLRMADALGVGLLLGGVLMVLGVVVLLACVIAILILSRRKTATIVHTSGDRLGT